MSLKVFLFLAPVALGGYYFANREAAPAAGTETAKAAAKAPARKSAQECRQLEQSLLEASAANPTANAFAAMQRLRAMHNELTSQGCEPGAGGPNFEAPRAAMGPPPPGADGPGQRHTGYDVPSGSPTQGTSFEPGRPMVDVSRNNSR